MATVSESAASLTFYSDELAPDNITQLLRSTPTRVEKKGESIKNPSGSTRIARHNVWLLQVERSRPGDLDGQFRELLRGLTDDLSVWDRLSKECEIEFFCGIFLENYNEQIIIQPATLKLIADRGILLDLDVYCRGNPQEN